TDLKIKLTSALTGADVNLKTLEGDLILKIQEGTNNGDVLRIKGKGVPSEHGRRGDLLVKITVEMPRKLSKEARKVIEDLKREGI
ncbi:MAG: DnaJ C-terminal domain-containing protein, partial [Candidatus Paceibacterota bacterium]